ncbi:MAG: hypothetical protein WCV56_07990, partial [Candidatus Omnitrophota bacterium]
HLLSSGYPHTVVTRATSVIRGKSMRRRHEGSIFYPRDTPNTVVTRVASFILGIPPTPSSRGALYRTVQGDEVIS